MFVDFAQTHQDGMLPHETPLSFKDVSQAIVFLHPVNIQGKLFPWLLTNLGSSIDSVCGGAKFVAESAGDSNRLLVLEVGTIFRSEFFELLNTERRPEKNLESYSTCFHEAAAAGAQLTMTATLSSTTLIRR